MIRSSFGLTNCEVPVNEKRFPILHDPSAAVDLSVNGAAAAQRVRYTVSRGVDLLYFNLRKEGLSTAFLLVDALRREAAVLLKREIGKGSYPSDLGPDSYGLWTCRSCDNINPPAALECLGNCGEMQPDEVEEPDAEEPETTNEGKVGAPPVVAPGNGVASESV